MPSDMRALTIRMPEDLLDEAAKMVPRLQARREEKDPDMRITGRRVTTADVIRVALAWGLYVLDREMPVLIKPTSKPVMRGIGKIPKKCPRCGDSDIESRRSNKLIHADSELNCRKCGFAMRW